MALGLVTAATLMLQIIETRIISVTSWYYLAFFVISIAMFGLTAGAVFVYLRTKRFSPERLSYDLAVAALAFALTTDLAILVQLTLADRRFAVGHLSGRLGGIRALSRCSVFLFGHCREPCADAQPLPGRKGLRSGSDRRGRWVHRCPRASECNERAIRGLVGRCADRARGAWVR